MSNLNVVVAGLPVLVDALKKTGSFSNVYGAKSTTELKNIITGPELKGVSKDSVAFIFGDSLDMDDPRFPMEVLVQKLAGGGWKVLVIGVSQKAEALVKANPSAGLVPVPITPNVILGSLAGYGFALEPLSADSGGFNPIDLFGAGPASAPPAPAFSTPAAFGAPPAFGTAAPLAFGATPPAPAERAPEPAPAPAPAPTTSFEKPAAPAPAPAAFGAPSGFSAPEPTSNGWSTPAPEPAATPAPTGWSTPAPDATPTAAPSWNAPATAAQTWAPPSGAPVMEQNAFAGSAPLSWEQDAPARRSLGSMSAAPSAPAYEAPSYQSSSYQQSAAPAFAPPSEPWAPAPNGGPVARGGAEVDQNFKSRRGMVITIAVSKGGTGKSSLTLNLAAFLALKLRAENKTVCVIDTNFQQADTSKYLNLFTPNIMSIANDPTLLSRERISQALIYKQDVNLSALLGPSTADDGNPQWITARLYNEILDLLKEQFDYILIDTPVAEKFHSIFSEFALPRADFIIVPVAPNNTTLHNADNWLRSAVTAPRHANGAGVEREKIGIVLNRAKDNIGCDENDVRANLANWNFLGSIPETDEWQKANNEFKLVANMNYAELNEAFAHVLYAATNEQVLAESFQSGTVRRAGVGKKLLGLLSGRKG